MDFGTASAVLSPILAGILAFIAGRRKSSAEARKIHAEADQIDAETFKQNLENAMEVIELYRRTAVDLGQQVQHLTIEVTGLRKENRELKSEMQKLEKMIQDFKTQST